VRKASFTRLARTPASRASLAHQVDDDESELFFADSGSELTAAAGAPFSVADRESAAGLSAWAAALTAGPDTGATLVAVSAFSDSTGSASAARAAGGAPEVAPGFAVPALEVVLPDPLLAVLLPTSFFGAPRRDEVAAATVADPAFVLPVGPVAAAVRVLAVERERFVVAPLDAPRPFDGRGLVALR